MVEGVHGRSVGLVRWVTADALKILFIGIQLALIVLAVRQFGILDTAFRYICALAVPGFLIHAALPMQYRQPFFLVLSLAGVILVLGFTGAATLFAVGGVLVAICYLPVPFAARAGAIAAIGLLLGAGRGGLVPMPLLADIWPVLASMFMFRMILYLYDTRHEKARPPVTQTLNYFFMLPNVCFPLFPVVDYKKFNRSHYNAEACETYQRGVVWMLRGVVHLLLYRFVYQNLALDPATAAGLGEALQFSFSAFLLYFQVSGTFHVAIGMLLLFGFNLPETHHRYFLATSFNDLWRRINIYWKDFMMKVVYYPVYFQVRRYGDRAAIVISTLVVFVGTWLLHAYQWFWLRGSFLLEWHDGLFWLVLAVLVVANALYESEYGRDRQAASHPQSWWDRASVGASTLATFLTMGLLWGMWSSDGLQQWMILWGTTDGAWKIFTVLIPGLFAASLLLKHAGRHARREAGTARPALRKPLPEFWKPAAVTTAGIVAVIALGTSAFDARLPQQVAATVDNLRSDRLNDRGEAQLIRGYYEELVRVNRHMDGLWTLRGGQPDDWNEPSISGVKYATGDLRVLETAADLAYEMNGAHVETNRWGMRDGDYTKAKPAGTLRIAVLGASYVFGRGVANDEVFEAQAEVRLNASVDTPVELLNFAIEAMGPVRQGAMLEHKIVSFDPDVLLVFGHRNDANRTMVDLDMALEQGVDLTFQPLKAFAERAGWSANEPAHLRRQGLARFRYEIMDWAYQRMASVCREHGIRPVFVYLPYTGDTGGRLRIQEADLRSPRNAGFTMVMGLQDVFAGYDPDELKVASWDGHPNAMAHGLIAERLVQILLDDQRQLLTEPIP